MNRMAETRPESTSTDTASQLGPDALEAVFQREHERMFRAAYRVTGNSEDAEDVLQTVFLRLLRQDAWPQVNTDQELGHYLHRSAVNAALDVLRARKRRKVIPLETARRVNMPDASPTSSETGMAGQEMREQLRSALSEMSPRAAEMFSLRYFEGFGNNEIAGIFGTSQSVVGVTLHRTRDKLRTMMGEASPANTSETAGETK
jgi:RNA polymerase sigma-70 factor (ECF subfamily)